MLDRLTDDEAEVFEAIRNPDYGNFALVRSHLDGEDVAVIATVNDDDAGGMIVTPLAVLVTGKIMERLVDPTDPVTLAVTDSGLPAAYNPIAPLPDPGKRVE